jgi:hypothetical protein
MMNPNPDRCNQLRKLHVQLTNELKLLRESINKAEVNGSDTSIEALNNVKNLQASLQTVVRELEQCPPEETPVVASTLQPRARVSKDVRDWFPDSGEDGEEFESVVDEP